MRSTARLWLRPPRATDADALFAMATRAPMPSIRWGRLRTSTRPGRCSPGGHASVRVLEKLGMQRIGELDDVPAEPPSLVYRIEREAFAQHERAARAPGAGTRTD